MELNVADLWEHVAAARPDRVAFATRRHELTYAALDERANRLAHVLAASGVGPGDRVAIHLFNGHEYLEAILAAFKIRAVPCNVNYRYTSRELHSLLGDAGAVFCITEPDLRARVDAVSADLPALRAVMSTGSEYEAAIGSASPTRPPARRSGDDRYVLYTGGTTGTPKGVVWRHEDLYYAALGGDVDAPLHSVDDVVGRLVDPPLRCYLACPLMHGTAHWMALSVLLLGGTVLVSDGSGFDPERALCEIVEGRANSLVIVGDAFARALLHVLDPVVAADESFPLRVVISGGATLSPATKRDLVAAMPEVLVVDGYGASESGGQGRAIVAAGSPSGTEGAPFRVGPETFVVDEQLRRVPAGTPGRIVRAGHVPLAYLNDPERTAATFPVVEGVRWAIPGDEGIANADGTITLLGRGAACIVTGGEKVFPDEVEIALTTLPEIEDAVVVGAPDARLGEHVAAVVTAGVSGVVPSLPTLQDRLRPRLAGYKLPRELVVVPEIVRLPTGKPDLEWARAQLGR